MKSPGEDPRHKWAKDFIHVIKNYHLLALKFSVWPYSMRAYAFPLLTPGLHPPLQNSNGGNLLSFQTPVKLLDMT